MITDVCDSVPHVGHCQSILESQAGCGASTTPGFPVLTALCQCTVSCLMPRQARQTTVLWIALVKIFAFLGSAYLDVGPGAVAADGVDGVDSAAHQ